MHGQGSGPLNRSQDGRDSTADDDDDDLINPGSPTAMDDTDDEELSLGGHSPTQELRSPGLRLQDSSENDDRVVSGVPSTSLSLTLPPTSIISANSLIPPLPSSSASSVSPSTSVSPHQLSPSTSSSPASRPSSPVTSFIKSEPTSSMPIDSRPLPIPPVTSLPLMSSLAGTLSSPLGLNGLNPLPFSSENFRFPHHPFLGTPHPLFHPLSLHHPLPLMSAHHNPFFTSLQSHAHSSS